MTLSPTKLTITGHGMTLVITGAGVQQRVVFRSHEYSIRGPVTRGSNQHRLRVEGNHHRRTVEGAGARPLRHLRATLRPVLVSGKAGRTLLVSDARGSPLATYALLGE
jgi:hypothetical protein